MTRRARWSLAVTALAASVAGCKRAPAAGGECESASASTTVCADHATQLRCEPSAGGPAAKYRAYRCRGPKGCSDRGCDTSIAEEGDECHVEDASPGANEACTADRTAKLECLGGKFVHEEHCRGPAGCDVATKRCDTSVTALGDACRPEGDATCSADGKRVLRCRDGKQAKGEWCHGPGGCQLHEDAGIFSCDQRIGAVGEGCTSIGDSCTLDGSQVIACERGRFVLRTECGKKRCVPRETTGDILRARCE